MGECPPIELLHEIAAGRASDPALLGHVSSCRRCRTRSRHHDFDRLLLVELGAAMREEEGAAPVAAPLPAIDGHEVVRELHRGGQGVVFEALQLAPRRKVALKVLLEGVFASAERLRRFEREIDLVATLRHPNLVTVHGSGRARDGRHWFTMEFVVGVPLDEHAARRRAAGWTTREALALFTKICSAVGYAHQRGVVHRDLKPANVLVDEAGEPRVLDFGLAKTLGAVDDERSAATRDGLFLGTLAYASPEQVRGEVDQLDVRTDVYSLGVILHELLTGEMPYASKGSMPEAVNAILSAEPRPPRGCDDELAAILQKALEKERDRRYSSATELLRDVEHYLRGDPIDAKRGRTGYLLRKTLARHRIAAAVASAFLLVVVAASFVSTYFAQESLVAADKAQRNARTARRVSRFLQDMLWSLQPDQAKGADLTVREVLDEQARRIDRELADEPEALAALHSTIGRTYLSLGLFEPAERHCALALEMRRGGVGEVDVRTGDLVALAAVRRERGDRAGADAFLREAEEFLAEQPECEPPLRAAVLNAKALVRFSAGDASGAEPLFQQALDLLRGADRPVEAATILDNVALLLHDRGDFTGAEARLRESLDLLRERGDLELVAVARGQRHLARALAELGRHDEAIPAARDAFELGGKLLGEEDPFTILALTELASYTAARDGYAAAKPLHERARQLRPKLAQRRDRTCANALNELALLAMRRGDLEEADELLQEAIALYEQLLGHEHRYVATALISHSWLFAARGLPVEAERRARAALELQRRVFPPGDPHVAGGLMNLAWIVLGAGRPLDAEPLVREALELQEECERPDPPGVARTRSALAWILHCQGDDAAAEPLCRAALEVQLAADAAGEIDLATSQHVLSEVLASLGRLDEAEPLARAALAIRRHRLDETDADVAMSLDALGRLLLQQGRVEEARAPLEEALAMRRKLFPRGHLHLVWSLDNVGAWHFQRRDLAAAELHFQEAVDVARDVLGDSHPELGVALGNLASLRVERDDPASAAALLAESWEILRASRGPRHPQTVRMLELRIVVHRALGEASEAAECAELLREARGGAPRR